MANTEIDRFARDFDMWAIDYFMQLGLSRKEAESIDWRKLIPKVREECGEATIRTLKPYLAQIAGEGLKN